jgi:signal transduction histidine kinase
MTSDTIAIPHSISGRWLRRVRAAWYVAAVLALAIVIVAIPGYVRAVPGGFSVIQFAVNPSPAVVAINVLTALLSFATVLLSLSLAFLLFRRQPTDRMALFLSFYLLAFGVTSGPFILADPVPTAGVTSFFWNVIFTPLIMYPASCFLFLLFPDGRFAPDWSRRVALASLITAPVMAAIDFLVWIDSSPPPLVGLVLGSLPPLVVLSAVLYAQYCRYRYIASPQQRQQIKWFVYGLGTMLFILFSSAIPYFWSFTLPEDTPYPVWLALTSALYFLSFAILPVSLTIAVMRHRLYEIDILINRTLVYGGLSLLIAGLYVLTIAGVGAAVQRGSNLASLFLASFLALILIRPLRTFLERGADRLVPVEADLQLQHLASERPLPDPFSGKRIETSVTDHAPDTALTSWSARRLPTIRAAWYVAALLALAIVIVAIPGYIRAVPEGFSVVEFTVNPSRVVVAINALSALLSVGTVLLSFYLAFLLFRRRPTDRMALFLSFYLLGFGVFSGPFELLEPLAAASVTIFIWNVILTPLIIYPASCFLFLLFPDGRFAPDWSRRLAWASLITAPVLSISFLIWSDSEPRPLAAMVTGSLAPVVVMSGVLYAQFYRYRHIASGQQRQQIKWVAYGLGIMLFIQVATGFPYFWSFTLPAGTPYPAWLALSTALYFLSFAALPISLTIAVMRHRLYDIDSLINRTLVYGALSAVVIGLYMLAVGSLSVLFQIRNNLIISLFVTGLVAVLFQPLREWLQARVSRIMFGERDNPVIVLARLGEQIEANVPLSELLTGILETVSKSLKLPYAAVELGLGEKAITAAEYGRPLDTTERLPLVTHGEQIGRLVVSPRSPGHGFSAAERLLLENIARQTGAAVYAGQLYADLQNSRQQIVTAREEERRRLRRDLHDGIGPTMASQTLKLDAAMDLISGDPETGEGKDLVEATRLLLELKEQTQESVKNIRRIVYALRPPALDDLGLIPAIQAHIDQQTRSLKGLQVTINARPEELPSLPAAVEVVVYRIVLEAFTNVIHHAQAQSCKIDLTITKDQPRELRVDIVDDGRGLSHDVKHGVGLSSMRERAEEVGGTFKIDSEPGQGTRVWARIPLLRGES